MTQKVSISLTNEAAETVRAAAESAGVSTSEVIRRALAIQRFVNREIAAGSTILVRKPNGDLERVEMVFG